MISTKNIKQKNCFHHWNVSWAANHHIRRISERSCITEDWSNDSALPSQEQITFQNILNRRKKKSQCYCFLGSTHAALVSILFEWQSIWTLDMIDMHSGRLAACYVLVCTGILMCWCINICRRQTEVIWNLSADPTDTLTSTSLAGRKWSVTHWTVC